MRQFIKKFDAYANPVTLTYNQEKTFTTFQGGICSIITGLILLYNFSELAVNLILKYQYDWAVQRSAVDSMDPELYNITTPEWNILTSIKSSNATINETIDRYVGGVYI